MNFLFLSPIAWDNMDGAHRPVRFAAELACRGHRALYIELEKSRASPGAGNPRVGDLEELGMAPERVLAAYYGFDYGEMDGAASQLERLLERWEAHEAASVAIVSAPFRPFLEFLPPLRARGYRLVFDVLDDYAAMRGIGYFCYDAQAEQFLARQCDLALPLSPLLEAKLSAYGAPRVCLLKDGVDLDAFRAGDHAPHAAIPRGDLTLGFWGWMWRYNFDTDLVSRLARARPQWQVHLLGPCEDAVARALALPNVHFHGRVARAALPAYAAQFDVCLLPAPNDAFNQARDPLKVYEYLACGRPVVATQQLQLAGRPGVYLARDADEFIAGVERAAREKFDAARVEAFLAEQTWGKRVDELLRALETVPAAKRPLPAPPRGAHPGAAGDLERWQAYARHLEKLAAEQRAHLRAVENALAQSGFRAKWKRLWSR